MNPPPDPVSVPGELAPRSTRIFGLDLVFLYVNFSFIALFHRFWGVVSVSEDGLGLPWLLPISIILLLCFTFVDVWLLLEKPAPRPFRLLVVILVLFEIFLELAGLSRWIVFLWDTFQRASESLEEGAGPGWEGFRTELRQILSGAVLVFIFVKTAIRLIWNWFWAKSVFSLR
ncbi:hypothetical protein EHQ12_14660 [Leptospira gomenensis]|uniref:Uncharacterized protein n=1 Tax=Leptospira gomenensis TaxID=2484974 RepID=A0A5F1Y8M8_9LEPT|nr:hypothetical protein [Leptospira gomenensis]TGK31730.1 hypothetical protein EHQ17_13185 [Leptospira gomenensis]TGK36109.1 hypothetical protein EHQ12_14660 [Leptospira gomenensis]TGK41642.1 hypothetical protein EHQ07_16290 [Leptospira gomenensis]TGK61399.1 hypothetical protein EHQ13_08580 [Leptospira gomenensis]